MKDSVFSILCAFIATLLFISCKKQPASTGCGTSTYPVYIDSVKGKTYGTPGDTIYYQYKYAISGCETTDALVEQVTGNTRIISQNVKNQNCGACPAIAQLKWGTYKFVPPTIGTFYLKFYQASSQYITDTVIVK